MRVSVILPAAGLGTRMSRSAGAASRKQFMLLDGSPIFLRTVRRFAACDKVSEIVIAVPDDDVEWIRSVVAEAGVDKPVRVVRGGATRQQSVENALATVDSSTDLVAVHDAVRPFIDPEVIESVITEAAETGAAIVGIVPVDTVKRVSQAQAGRAQIRTTLPREHLVLAQTPQVFRYDLLKRAFERAREDHFVGTDESSLVERLDEVVVTVVPGSDQNIKITKPTDMKLAELYARRAQEAEENA